MLGQCWLFFWPLGGRTNTLQHNTDISPFRQIPFTHPVVMQQHLAFIWSNVCVQQIFFKCFTAFTSQLLTMFFCRQCTLTFWELIQVTSFTLLFVITKIQISYLVSWSLNSKHALHTTTLTISPMPSNQPLWPQILYRQPTICKENKKTKNILGGFLCHGCFKQPGHSVIDL